MQKQRKIVQIRDSESERDQEIGRRLFTAPRPRRKSRKKGPKLEAYVKYSWDDAVAKSKGPREPDVYKDTVCI